MTGSPPHTSFAFVMSLAAASASPSSIGSGKGQAAKNLRKDFEKWARKDSSTQHLPDKLDELMSELLSHPQKIFRAHDFIMRLDASPDTYPTSSPSKAETSEA